jgi:soluble lytic murein transglycosylase-like protein
MVSQYKIGYICFLMAGAMLAAHPSRAAENEQRKVVVRADPRTGRLVRSVTGPKIAPKEIALMVDQAARAHDVDPLLVHSVIQVESNYDSNAVSPKGAQGLMQLTPSTARMLGVSDSFDARENIEAGVKYLKYLQSVYKDDRLALAAYNAGPGAVEKYKSIPPYPETQNYVKQVGKRYDDARRTAAAETPAPKAAPEFATTAPEEKHPKLEAFVDQEGRLHLRTAN